LTFNCFSDIALFGVLHGVERLNLEFTFPIWSRNIEPEPPSETLGTGNFADTAMLIPLTTDFHLATLPGVEDVAILSVMVFYGVPRPIKAMHLIDSE
jgi:hypothetical protein